MSHPLGSNTLNSLTSAPVRFQVTPNEDFPEGDLNRPKILTDKGFYDLFIKLKIPKDNFQKLKLEIPRDNFNKNESPLEPLSELKLKVVKGVSDELLQALNAPKPQPIPEAKPDHDGSLKPVTMRIRFEKKTIGPSDGSGRQEAVVHMSFLSDDGTWKSWKYDPYYDEDKQEFKFLDNPLSREVALGHDLLEHILTPWVGAYDSEIGEYMAGRVGPEVQYAPEGDQLWQPLLVHSSKSTSNNEFFGLYARLQVQPDGAAVTLDFTIPPPDRSFGYANDEANAVVSDRRYYSNYHDLRVDDRAEPTGHPWQPITLDHAVISGVPEENLKAFKTRLASFEDFFIDYQDSIGEGLREGTDWISRIRNYFSSFSFLTFKLVGTTDAGPEDYRRQAYKFYPPEGSQKFNVDNITPAPTFMPAGAIPRAKDAPKMTVDVEA